MHMQRGKSTRASTAIQTELSRTASQFTQAFRGRCEHRVSLSKAVTSIQKEKLSHSCQIQVNENNSPEPSGKYFLTQDDTFCARQRSLNV